MIHMAEIMENQHGHRFDKVIVNGDMAVGLRELKADIERMLKAEVQWIPAETKRFSATTVRRSCSHLSGWI